MLKCLARVLILAVCLRSAALAYRDSSLVRAFDQMVKPSADSTTAIRVEHLDIEAHDLLLHLDSGTVYFFAPVTLDSAPLTYGGFFDGYGRLEFRPSVDPERSQLRRFFGSDSLNRSFTRVMLLFNGGILTRLQQGAVSTAAGVPGGTARAIKHYQDFLADDEQKYFLFAVLKNLAFPRTEPFLLLTTELNHGGQVIYTFDPFDREEVWLLKYYSELGSHDFMETICQYSVAAGNSIQTINGMAKPVLAVANYETDGSISRSGKYRGSAKVTARVEPYATQLVMFYLDDELVVDSILDATNQRVCFLRFKKKRHQDGGVYVVLPDTVAAGQRLELKFFYGGSIAETKLGHFFVEADAGWYPRAVSSTRSTFDMTFRTPADYAFVATGREMERRRVGDTLYTRFSMSKPAYLATFNIGLFKKYSFSDSATVRVDIYFSESLHDDLGTYLVSRLQGVGSHMERQVAQDIQGSLRVFSFLFGPQSSDRISVSEILQAGSDAYPGYVRLGYSTWINTDAWGEDRLLRSHEVAHQWWGIEVENDSYRDQWLSEGFSEYSALMYLQAIRGNDLFQDKLKEYARDILSSKGTKAGDDFEGPSILLGPRTNSTKTPEAKSLLVYKKGAYVLHMLRNLLLDLRTMKEDRFMSLMKDYYSSFRNSDISTCDFQRLVERHVGQDMGWFFDEWVYHSYLPTYTLKYETAGIDSAGCKIMLHITQSDVPAGFQMLVPLEIQFDDGKAYLRLLIDRPQVDLPLELPKVPRKLVLNPFCSVLARISQ